MGGDPDDVDDRDVSAMPVRSDGDLDAAVDLLRTKGAAKAAKRGAEREATAGLSLKCVDSAPIASNMQLITQCSSSPPPANTMSCAPWRIRSAPAPMQCAEVAQAADSE